MFGRALASGVAAAAATFALGTLGTAHATVTESGGDVHPGVYHGVRVDDSIPVRVHIVEIDLSSAEIRLRATAEGERGVRTSDWAAQVGAAVALNGDLYDALDFSPDGLARGGAAGAAATWGVSADNAVEGLLVFDRSSNVNHARISPPEELVLPADLGAEIEGAIGGRPLLVRAGAAVAAFDCDDALVLACERAPRAAVGISQDGRTLILVVVDGWQPASHGWTAGELATFLEARGAYDALGLDPGASATLVIPAQGGVVNAPSDGAERVVSNHLGVQFGALPPGTLVGFIRDSDLFNGANIAGAKATLDTGATYTVGADALYSFPGLPPRFTCVTASAAGYHPATQCKNVLSGMTIFNSMALFPDSLFIDAGPGGPPDAGAQPPADAAPLPDGASPDDDGGAPDASAAGVDGSGGCGCRVGGLDPRRCASGAFAACMAGVLFVMLLAGHRRGRKQLGP